MVTVTSQFRFCSLNPPMQSKHTFLRLSQRFGTYEPSSEGWERKGPPPPGSPGPAATLSPAVPRHFQGSAVLSPRCRSPRGKRRSQQDGT